MLILIEGPNGVGKTYLTNKIAQRLRYNGYGNAEIKQGQFSFVEFPNTPLGDYERPLLSYRPGMGKHIICDRWYETECINTNTDVAVLDHIRLFLVSRGALTVYVYEDSYTIQARNRHNGNWAHKNQTQMPIQYLKSICTAQVNRTIQWKSTRVDVDSIISIARLAERSASALNPFTTYVGPPNPECLILGKNRGVRTGSSDPAWMPHGRTSAHYLLTSLHRYLSDWTLNTGIANVCDVDNIEDLRNVLNDPLVVTLGHDAAEATGKNFGTAPHPQYIRRFHHRHGLAYAGIVNQALNTQKDFLQWKPRFQLSKISLRK